MCVCVCDEKVPLTVYKNLQSFCSSKKPTEEVFDELSVSERMRVVMCAIWWFINVCVYMYACTCAIGCVYVCVCCVCVFVCVYVCVCVCMCVCIDCGTERTPEDAHGGTYC